MKKTALSLVLAAVLVLAGCTSAAQGATPGGGATSAESAVSVLPDASGGAVSALSEPGGKFEYTAEALVLVNETLENYASGFLPEPMRYNSDYTGINNAPPLDSTLPASVTQDEVRYDRRYGELIDTVVATLTLENSYTMDIHMETEGAAGRPQRVTGVYYYDMEGSGQADYAVASRGGEFLHLKSDRLFASADFEDVRTDAGLVSGSISWGKANRFLWIDVDSMKEPFFYTYYLADDGVLTQDYPQKDWQRYSVVNDDKMMIIAQSLYEQFRSALEAAELQV